MVHITEELVRRRAEHNDGEMFSLEELSLHQQDIHKIQHLEQWCRQLRILYLQNNLISTIENVGRLKKLQYLNLALNNIELIENLEGCESLQKLDLTVNFVGRLSSVESLKHNVHLRELFLLGNPCADFKGYRPYVISTLPQLQFLDGTEISRSERLRASQGLDQLRALVHQQEQEYVQRREREKEEAGRGRKREEEESEKERKRGEREMEEAGRGRKREEREEEEAGRGRKREEREEEGGKERKREEREEEKAGKERKREKEEAGRGRKREEEESEKERKRGEREMEEAGKERKRERREEEAEKENRGKERRPGFDGRWYTDITHGETKQTCTEEEQAELDFWQTPCSFSPESRLATHRHLEEKRRAKDKDAQKKPPPPRTLIAKDGRVLNANEPKLDFCLTEDEDNATIVLDLAVYRHLDTSLIDVDIQPNYVRVLVKGKVFQMVLPAEVKPDASSAQRSQSTGHLVLTMPRILVGTGPKKREQMISEFHLHVRKNAEGEIRVKKNRAVLNKQPEHSSRPGAAHERLEVDSSALVDFTNIVQRPHSGAGPLETRGTAVQSEPSVSPEFVDDPDVPPLM